MIISVKKAALERAHHCIKVLGERFLTSVRIIYGSTEKGSPFSLGTCFLLEVDGARYVVTAAHVIDEAAHCNLYVGGKTSLAQLVGEFHCIETPSDGRSRDYIDFAFRRLSDGEVNSLGNLHYLTLKEVSHNKGRFDGRLFMVLGYPNSQNKKIDVVNRHVEASAWTYSGFHAEDADLLKLVGGVKDAHLFLRYDKRSQRTSGSIENTISPRGASGGAIFDLGRPDPANLAPGTACGGNLAGMFIEQRKSPKVMIFTRIEIIIQAIQEKYPPLKQNGGTMFRFK